MQVRFQDDIQIDEMSGSQPDVYNIQVGATLGSPHNTPQSDAPHLTNAPQK